MATVVHRASPDAVTSVLERLSEEGVEATALDDPGPLTLIAAFGSYRVRIAVAEGDAERAREVLEAWDRDAAPRLRALAAELRRQFALAALVALVVAGALWASGVIAGHWALLALVPLWAVAALVLGARSRAA